MNPRIIRTMLLSLLCMAAASTVQGRIYLKDGRVIECGEKDRIELPKHERDVKLLRRAFYKDKSKEIYRYEEIDSIVCWHAENSVFKKENYSFKVTRTPDDKEPIEYTADDVVSIDYIETTENHPDGLHWESHPLAKPNFAGRYHTLQMLFCVDKVGKNATTYWRKIAGQFGAHEGSLPGSAGFLQEVVQGARGQGPQEGGRGERRLDSRHV